MKRWLLLPLVVGVAAIAAYAVLSVPLRSGPESATKTPGQREVERRPKPAPTRPAEPLPDRPTLAPVPVEQPEIREPSRERLREILREAEREDR